MSSSVSGTHGGNYQLNATSSSWIIQKKLINLIDTWFIDGTAAPYSDSAFVYDKTVKRVTAGYVSGAAADNDYKVYDGDNISFVYTNNSGIAAGTSMRWRLLQAARPAAITP